MFLHSKQFQLHWNYSCLDIITTLSYTKTSEMKFQLPSKLVPQLNDFFPCVWSNPSWKASKALEVQPPHVLKAIKKLIWNFLLTLLQSSKLKNLFDPDSPRRNWRVKYLKVHRSNLAFKFSSKKFIKWFVAYYSHYLNRKLNYSNLKGIAA